MKKIRKSAQQKTKPVWFHLGCGQRNIPGFINIDYDWRKTIHKDYDDHSQGYIPHRDKILISLNIEATKNEIY